MITILIPTGNSSQMLITSIVSTLNHGLVMQQSDTNSYMCTKPQIVTSLTTEKAVWGARCGI